VFETWGQIGELQKKGDIDGALERLTKARAMCADTPSALRVIIPFHADMALHAGRPEVTVMLLEQVDLLPDRAPEANFWGLSRWTYMAALHQLGNFERFKTVRAELIAQHHKQLLARVGADAYETLETDYATIHAYRGPIAQRNFLRNAVFVAVPKNNDLPQTLAITDTSIYGLLFGENEKPKAPILMADHYTCGEHVLLGQPQLTTNKEFDYKKAAKYALDIFSSADHLQTAQSSSTVPGCGYINYVLPGFEPGEDEEDEDGEGKEDQRGGEER
jgi:hypothetical protein